jgi:hypothetical protein
MKLSSIQFLLCVSLAAFGTSCKKQTIYDYPDSPKTSRKIQFFLSTDKDVSNNNDSIFFRLVIQNSSNATMLWDSSLAPMKIKDIPNLAHKIAVEKLVPGNTSIALKCGFLYSIKNVGNASHYVPSPANEVFTIVAYNFQ